MRAPDTARRQGRPRSSPQPRPTPAGLRSERFVRMRQRLRRPRQCRRRIDARRLCAGRQTAARSFARSRRALRRGWFRWAVQALTPVRRSSEHCAPSACHQPAARRQRVCSALPAPTEQAQVGASHRGRASARGRSRAQAVEQTEVLETVPVPVMELAPVPVLVPVRAMATSRRVEGAASPDRRIRADRQ